MKDLDFDELDRAVNSLMGSVPKDHTKPEQPAVVIPTSPEPAVAPAPQLKVDEVEEAPAVVSEDVQPTPAPRSSAPTPAFKRSGRFMDVVPPAAAAKQRETVSSPSRVGTTIAPRSDNVSPVSSKKSAAPKPLFDAVKQSTEQKSWPDPLDFTTTETKSEVKSLSSPVDVTYQSPDSSSTSPFLSDAKVEKRPLGNDGSELAQKLANETVSTHDTSLDNQPIEKQDKVTDEPPVQPMQPELASDLLSIESGEPKEVKETKESTPLDHRLSDHSTSSPTGSTSAVTPNQLTSITQQYKEQASSGDQSHAAIYDTEDYPVPMAHPAKKKSGWLWIIWVLLLLIVGAGGAVLLYMFHII